MEFRKVTISLPKNMYDAGIGLINRGLFSNFSDLVRSGIRNEFKEAQQMSNDFDERSIYRDKALIAGVKKSMKEARAGKGRIVKARDADKYFEAL